MGLLETWWLALGRASPILFNRAGSPTGTGPMDSTRGPEDGTVEENG